MMIFAHISLNIIIYNQTQIIPRDSLTCRLISISVQGGMPESNWEIDKKAEYKTPKFLGLTRVRWTMKGPEPKMFYGDSSNEQLP